MPIHCQDAACPPCTDTQGVGGQLVAWTGTPTASEPGQCDCDLSWSWCTGDRPLGVWGRGGRDVPRASTGLAGNLSAIPLGLRPVKRTLNAQNTKSGCAAESGRTQIPPSLPCYEPPLAAVTILLLEAPSHQEPPARRVRRQLLNPLEFWLLLCTGLRRNREGQGCRGHPVSLWDPDAQVVVGGRLGGIPHPDVSTPQPWSYIT